MSASKNPSHSKIRYNNKIKFKALCHSILYILYHTYNVQVSVTAVFGGPWEKRTVMSSSAVPRTM